jgi:hypothetical protein
MKQPFASTIMKFACSRRLERTRHLSAAGRPAGADKRKQTMTKKTCPIAPSICFAAGLLTIAASHTANASECFPGPDFKLDPGTRWDYRIDPATKQGCWYVKDLGASSRRRTGEVARSSRSVPASSSTSESAATSGAPRSDRGEETPASDPQSSIKSWFSSTFAPLFGLPNAYSTTETDEAATSGPGVTPKRDNESTVTRQRQRSKQQTKVAQRKSERAQGESKRAQRAIASIFEAAGDKPVLSPPILSGQDLQKAIEAVGDKDVVIAPTALQEDWQQALYEEFLRWRLRQLIP